MRRYPKENKKVGEADLADPSPGLVSLLLVPPVASSQGIPGQEEEHHGTIQNSTPAGGSPQTVGYDPGLDGQLEVEVLALVYELLGVHAHLLHQVLEESPENTDSVQ